MHPIKISKAERFQQSLTAIVYPPVVVGVCVTVDMGAMNQSNLSVLYCLPLYMHIENRT